MKRYTHQAMAAPFEIILPDIEPQRAAQISQVCFDEIDRIETEISRWNPSSDTGLINGLHKGQSTVVSIDCFECLAVAQRMHAATNGVFDVTIGPLLRGQGQSDVLPAGREAVLQRVPLIDELHRRSA